MELSKTDKLYKVWSENFSVPKNGILRVFSVDPGTTHFACVGMIFNLSENTSRMVFAVKLNLNKRGGPLNSLMMILKKAEWFLKDCNWLLVENQYRPGVAQNNSQQVIGMFSARYSQLNVIELRTNIKTSFLRKSKDEDAGDLTQNYAQTIFLLEGDYFALHYLSLIGKRKHDICDAIIYPFAFLEYLKIIIFNINLKNVSAKLLSGI
jgi:hypothetical protein